MLGLVFNWLKKRLGYHVCEEFTQWKIREANYERVATSSEWVVTQSPTVEFTRRWQERRCTICGNTQMQSLDPHRL